MERTCDKCRRVCDPYSPWCQDCIKDVDRPNFLMPDDKEPDDNKQKPTPEQERTIEEQMTKLDLDWGALHTSIRGHDAKLDELVDRIAYLEMQEAELVLVGMMEERLKKVEKQMETLKSHVAIMETTHQCMCGHSFYCHPHYSGNKCIALDEKTGKLCECQVDEETAPEPRGCGYALCTDPECKGSHVFDHTPEPDIERLAEVAHNGHYPAPGIRWWTADEDYKENTRNAVRAILKELGHEGEERVGGWPNGMTKAEAEEIVRDNPYDGSTLYVMGTLNLALGQAILTNRRVIVLEGTEMILAPEDEHWRPRPVICDICGFSTKVCGGCTPHPEPDNNESEHQASKHPTQEKGEE